MMMNNFRKFGRYVQSHGLAGALKKSVHYVINGPASGTSAFSGPKVDSKNDVIGYTRSYLGHAHGNPSDKDSIDPGTMQWVIPDFGFGSGGHLNIFRFVNLLAERGYKQRVVILPPYGWQTADAARAAIASWYFPLNADIALGLEGFIPSDITIATGWQTAYWVSHHQASLEKIYFVQDFEPFFYPVSSEYFLAENTYKLGMKAITAGTWLSDKLSEEYGMLCRPVSFACDSRSYFPHERRPGPNFNILFYSRHSTKRRLFEIGLAALNIVCERVPNAAVIFAGGDVGAFHIPFHHLNAGELSLKVLPDLYSQCDLALVLSGTNLSLLPLELAACRCPVVLNDTPSARWLLPEDAAFYAPLNPEGLAETIIKAIENETDRIARAEAAYKISIASSWEKEADKFVENLSELRS